MTALAIGLALADSRPPPGEVRVLTNANFEDETQASTGATTGDWFVKFYAPWCGHCKALAPTWDDLAWEIRKTVTVAKVDVTENRALGQRFGITGFPTLLFFRQGKVYKYKGMRTVEALEAFANGGYRDTDPKDVPPPPSAVVTVLTDLMQWYTNMLQNNFAMAILVLVGVSLVLSLVLVGLFICLCDEPPKQKRRYAPKPPSGKPPKRRDVSTGTDDAKSELSATAASSDSATDQSESKKDK